MASTGSSSAGMCDVLSFAGGAIGDEQRDEDLAVLFELHAYWHPDVDFLGWASHHIGGEPESFLIRQLDDGDVVGHGDRGVVRMLVRGVREDGSPPARGLVCGGTAAVGARG